MPLSVNVTSLQAPGPFATATGGPPRAARNVSVNPVAIGQGTSWATVDPGSPLTSAASRRTAVTEVIVTGAGAGCDTGPDGSIVTSVTEDGITSAAGRGGCHSTIASAMITACPLPVS